MSAWQVGRVTYFCKLTRCGTIEDANGKEWAFRESAFNCRIQTLFKNTVVYFVPGFRIVYGQRRDIARLVEFENGREH